MNYYQCVSASKRKGRQRARDAQELELKVYTLTLRPAELARMRERFIRCYGHDWTPTARRAHAGKMRASLTTEVREQLTLQNL
jgi:hypothetical protein